MNGKTTAVQVCPGCGKECTGEGRWSFTANVRARAELLTHQKYECIERPNL